MRFPILLAFLGNLSAFILLILVTFSVPVINELYFLRSSVFGGTRFGVLGYCIESPRLSCSSLRIGYHFEPELYWPLPRVLVLYPVAVAFSGTAALLLMPSFFPQYGDQKPPIMYDILASASFFSSAAAFAVSMWLFARAMGDFHGEGFSASFGPSMWMSLAAMIVTLLVALHTFLGSLKTMRARYARRKAVNIPVSY